MIDVVVGIGAFFALAYARLVKVWMGDRFQQIEDRQDEQDARVEIVEGKVDALKHKVLEHDIVQARMDEKLNHIQKSGDEGRDSMRRLHDKLDKLLTDSNHNNSK